MPFAAKLQSLISVSGTAAFAVGGYSAVEFTQRTAMLSLDTGVWTETAQVPFRTFRPPVATYTGKRTYLPYWHVSSIS